jgi:hypothetical protein
VKLNERNQLKANMWRRIINGEISYESAMAGVKAGSQLKERENGQWRNEISSAMSKA